MTATGGPPEIVRNGVDGLVLAPRDPQGWAAAIAPLLSDAERLAAMSRAGRERAREFAREVHVERVVSIYRDVLSSTAA